MYKTKNYALRLAEVMASEYDDHLERWEALKAARSDQFHALHHTQSQAIVEALKAWAELETSFSELYSPSFDDICRANTAMANLRFHFNLDEVELKDD